MTPAPLYRDEWLEIAALDGAGGRLSVVFQSSGAGAAPEFLGLASRGGRFPCLIVTERQARWANSPRFLELTAEVVRDFAEDRGLERVHFVGRGMGGFNALAASGPAGADLVLAIGTPFTIDPAYWDENPHWRGVGMAIGQIRVPTVEPFLAPRTLPILVHGTGPGADEPAAAYARLRQVLSLRLPFADRGLAAAGAGDPRLGPLFLAAFDGNLPALSRRAAALGADLILPRPETAAAPTQPME